MIYVIIDNIEKKCADCPEWSDYLAHLTNDDGTAILFA